MSTESKPKSHENQPVRAESGAPGQIPPWDSPTLSVTLTFSAGGPGTGLAVVKAAATCGNPNFAPLPGGEFVQWTEYWGAANLLLLDRLRPGDALTMTATGQADDSGSLRSFLGTVARSGQITQVGAWAQGVPDFSGLMVYVFQKPDTDATTLGTPLYLFLGVYQGNLVKVGWQKSFSPSSRAAWTWPSDLSHGVSWVWTFAGTDSGILPGDWYHGVEALTV